MAVVSCAPDCRVDMNLVALALTVITTIIATTLEAQIASYYPDRSSYDAKLAECRFQQPNNLNGCLVSWCQVKSDWQSGNQCFQSSDLGTYGYDPQYNSDHLGGDFPKDLGSGALGFSALAMIVLSGFVQLFSGLANCIDPQGNVDFLRVKKKGTKGKVEMAFFAVSWIFWTVALILTAIASGLSKHDWGIYNVSKGTFIAAAVFCSFHGVAFVIYDILNRPWVGPPQEAGAKRPEESSTVHSDGGTKVAAAPSTEVNSPPGVSMSTHRQSGSDQLPQIVVNITPHMIVSPNHQGQAPHPQALLTQQPHPPSAHSFSSFPPPSDQGASPNAAQNQHHTSPLPGGRPSRGGDDVSKDDDISIHRNSRNDGVSTELFPSAIPPPKPGFLATSAGGGSNPTEGGSVRSRASSNGNLRTNSLVFFTYEELKAATGAFASSKVLGEGGFGAVYKGVLVDGTPVAVKRLHPKTSKTSQGAREFQAEVEIISRVHHRNLVRLLGYCSVDEDQLLVYEFAANGSLTEHIHNKGGKPPLDWPTRQKIALGAARALAYLHEECEPKIVHRDIKASNILLDSSMNAKVADFGLARLVDDGHTHVTTRVMGTFGYLAPEYALSGQLTQRSDVYSFGVVLLELITGRKPIDVSEQSRNAQSLIEWAWQQHRAKKDPVALIDPRLNGKAVPNEVRRAWATAVQCISHVASRRPTMEEVVRFLKGEQAPSAAASPDLDEDPTAELRHMAFTNMSDSNLVVSGFSDPPSEVTKIAPHALRETTPPLEEDEVTIVPLKQGSNRTTPKTSNRATPTGRSPARTPPKTPPRDKSPARTPPGGKAHWQFEEADNSFATDSFAESVDAKQGR